ncbi:alkaline phosphatase [Streptomyces paromomycinus]|uniref:Alkaline phosphatase n=1 Tax=Streptomyces paromomycinus TaxID=92743 RepID=Q2MFM8_STREY|nr:alkaline phosphatase [Streptomyces paromomycinus]GCD40686.1 alkaline phosphatase [Streptomyces paromomycinus]CAG44621.1 extracellular aminoglycoside phosphate phosphatase [Streptomyces paromomycinus]
MRSTSLPPQVFRRRLAWSAAALAVAVTATTVVTATADAGAGHRPRTAKNVILLIGDGMGDSEITLARDYTVGAGGRLHMDGFPQTGTYTTYSVDSHGRPDYVTDSAASATAWSTGHKTVNYRISKTPGTDRPMPTILELARRQGLATGSVTTAELTDATPAAMAAHVGDRDCQGPADMEGCPRDTIGRGGLGSIAEQSVRLRPDVLLGGGRQRFDQKITEGPYQGLTVAQQAEKLGYRIVSDARGLRAAGPERPVLGLFAPGAVPVEWTGRPAARGGTEAQRCVTANPRRPAGTPTLEAQTRKAVELLEAKARTGGTGKGFFLQVEGASIDKQNHEADPCGQIGETAAFDRAVKVARDYAERHPDTLVITTADHGHSSQIVPVDAEPMGLSATLVTDEGGRIKVSYATTTTPEDGQEHTGTQVRIAAQGPFAERVRGVTDQTELFTTITRALGLR